ncbi:peptidase C15 [Stenomitos frigidus]|uniref:Peptidase C15 n=1 Tax=Stenomitos frigidus ULC18 TaxID=2107698 RepID=A0A2T1DY98_9CYAN|nr:peptidase C15 [Stenomitos frigidus]PSB25477.1 peptidase C15 [Stenomitos frigidus ULC18]
MTKRILLTSFDIWEAHHRSNASDDLIAAMSQPQRFAEWREKVTVLRKLPVDFQAAPQQVIAQIDAWQPEIIVCCGMAESRTKLTVESNGKHQSKILQTSIDVDRLVEDLTVTQVSDDAGDFVCNHLYYSVLQYIQTYRLSCQCLFIHVPVLHEVNLEPVLQDFLTILQLLQQI